MSDDKIANALGLKPLAEVLDATVEPSTELALADPVEIVTVIAEDNETVRDIEQARGNIKNIIEQGDDALKEMMSLAKQSESPRAFEVASTLMKTLLDANKDFVEMSMKKKYAVDEVNAPKEAAQTNVVNNNLILSTTDLLKMLKGET
jgi:hypothetical protein